MEVEIAVATYYQVEVFVESKYGKYLTACIRIYNS